MTLLILALFFFAASPAFAQEVYKWKDDKGNWNFSHTPPTGKSAEKPLWVDKPIKLPRGLPCEPFKPGEAREPIAYDPGRNSPVAMISAEVKMTDGDAQRARFAWKITVKEVSGRPQVVGGVVKMMDCEMFPIAEESLKLTRLEAYQQIVLTGDTQIIGDRANKVGRYSVGIGTPNAPPQNPSQQTQSRETSLPKADVVVVSSTLRLRASSELWLVGNLQSRLSIRAQCQNCADLDQSTWHAFPGLYDTSRSGGYRAEDLRGFRGTRCSLRQSKRDHRTRDGGVGPVAIREAARCHPRAATSLPPGDEFL